MFKLVLIIIIGVLALACSAAFAQVMPPCLPAFPSTSDSPANWVQPSSNVAWIGSPLRIGYSRNGQWARWYCAEMGTGQLRTITYVGTLTDLPNVGGRLRTIIGAADSLKSLQTLPSRITMLPLTDPALAAIVAEVPK
jgi:hypothetical protein